MPLNMPDEQSPRLDSPKDNDFLPLVLYTLAAAVLAALSYSSIFTGSDLVLVWPAAGVCAWVAMRYGWKCAPVVFVSHGIDLAFSANGAAMLLTMNASTAVAYAVCAEIFRRSDARITAFDSVTSTLRFVIIIAVGISVATALPGSLFFVLFDNFPLSEYWGVFWIWVSSVFSGIILVTPAIIALNNMKKHKGEAPVLTHLIEGSPALLVSVAVVVCVGLLSFFAPQSLERFPSILLIMPLCVWLALKDEADSSTLWLTCTVFATVVLTFLLRGAFADSTRSQVLETTVLVTQPYAVMLILSCLIIRAAAAERSTALGALEAERSSLEAKVASRTSELKHIAETDVLTGLVNRRRFDAIVSACHSDAQENRCASQLLSIDLDRFKIVNDTSGHAAGDEMLKRVSELLVANVRASDVVARVGGDEFSILLKECPSEIAFRIAEKIRMDVCELRMSWDGDTHRIGASIGLVSFDPSLGEVEDIMQMADAACFMAKNNGRNRVHEANTSDKDVVQLRGNAQWVRRIEEALEHNHFVLYGQKIQSASIDANEPEHLEILIRLHDPATKELISPGAFLPAVERFGLAPQLDRWVVRELVRTIEMSAKDDGFERCYWVNLSGASVSDEQFIDQLIETVRNSSLRPGMINFEVTETAIIHNLDGAVRLMNNLKSCGCKFALDDFGTGVTSFSNLKTLPVDHLKIDGAFVKGLVDDEIDRIFVQSIIDIAHTMNMKAVVEMVENQEILDAVEAMGADYCQGFGIHRPEPLSPGFVTLAAAAGRTA